MSYTRDQILSMPAGVKLDIIIEEIIFNQRVSLYRYSTKISEAWKLVDIMISKGFSPTINTITTESFGHIIDKQKLGDYHCCFSKCDELYVHAYGNTAPEAICKAALLAILERSEQSLDVPK